MMLFLGLNCEWQETAKQIPVQGWSFYSMNLHVSMDSYIENEYNYPKERHLPQKASDMRDFK